MEIRKATAGDMDIFEKWGDCSRAEECTCRPVENGKRAAEALPTNVLTFVKEGYDEPIGKFLYFDYNSRNRSCEFGYMMNPKYRGKGFGVEMVGGGIGFLLSDSSLGLNKLYC